MSIATPVRDRLLTTVREARRPNAGDGSQRVSATGHCLRKQWYELTGARTNVTPSSDWEMADGDLHEDDIVYRLQQAGYTVTDQQTEVTINCGDGVFVKGHIDGIVSGNGLPRPSLLEVKSMSNLRYNRFVRTIVPAGNGYDTGLETEFPDYNYQMNMYLEGLGLTDCVFAVKSKDGGAVKRLLKGLMGVHPKLHVAYFRKDPMVVQEGKYRHRTLRQARETGDPPDREHKRTDWQCNWCPFQSTCWGSGLVVSDAIDA